MAERFGLNLRPATHWVCNLIGGLIIEAQFSVLLIVIYMHHKDVVRIKGDRQHKAKKKKKWGFTKYLINIRYWYLNRVEVGWFIAC